MRKLLVFYVLLMVVFTSCEKKKNCPKNNVIKVNLPYDPPTMDPRKGGDVASSAVQFMVFEGLTRLANSNRAELALAKKVDISDDLKTYTFYLREDAIWSDSTPITAYDFEDSWKSMLKTDFPCPNTNLLYPIKNAESIKKGLMPISELGVFAKNDKTFVVELEMPTPYFIELTSFSVFFPVKCGIDKTNANWANKVGDDFICSGPFKLKKWDHNNEIVVEKNKSYWNQKNIKLDEIKISLINDDNTVLNMYKSGELDIVGHPFTMIPLDAMTTLAKEKKLSIQPIAKTIICSLNVNKFPFNNKNIRKAFAYAIDRKTIVDNIMQLNEIPATCIIPPVLKNNSIREFFTDANSDLAKKCFNKGLEELNITKEDLKNLKLIYTTPGPDQVIVQEMQQRWKEVLEIDVIIENNETKTILDKMVKRDFQIAVFRWVAQYNDQMNIFERFKDKNNPKNYAGWENDDYIKILNRSMFCKNEKERLELFEKAEEILAEEMPIIPILHMNSIYMKKDFLKNVHVSPIGSMLLEYAYKETKE